MTDIRWKQRFQNYKKAYFLLKTALEEKDLQLYSDLEKEGIAQRYEYTFELAWKVLKDYLIFTGISLEQITPRAVIKEAFGAKIISDGQSWIEMLELRNLLSHTYDKKTYDRVLPLLKDKYLTNLTSVYAYLESQ
jgi:nucleotidyltransferase substrate binding protein (TIGR01987 family)